MDTGAPKIAFLMQDVGLGGIERTVINLLCELHKYPISLDLVLFEKKGVLLPEVPPGVRIIELPNATSSRLRRVFPVMRYLKQEKPTVLISQLPQFNVIAAIAKTLTGIPANALLVEHIGFAPLEDHLKNNLKERIGLLNYLRRFFYAKLDITVATVSQGLARELESNLHLKKGTIKVIYNPIVDEKTLLLKAQVIPDHPWFQPDQPPVFLGVGRLAPQKDFATLIKAFSILRQKGESARLVILGEGDEREKLEALVTKLNLNTEVSLPGFTDNPYAYMSRATAFVLSSRFESFGLVVAEALACGCQIISTDCPYGPSEIINSGEYGRLVPVGNPKDLAEAMKQAINAPVDSDLLRLRARDFSVEKIVSEYLRLINFDYLLEGKIPHKVDLQTPI
ncbi:MAG: glycosyltransferase [Pleurocapsa sp. CRU_1_2]|nr:glycosyltransferase [Pleurocapsa sp. CRU_1_2]